MPAARIAKLIPVLGAGLTWFSEAAERGERAFETLRKGGDERVKADLACELAGALNSAGSHKRALEWSETALVLAERFDDPALLAGAVGARSGALFNLGRHREAVMLARGMAALADAAGALREQATARVGLSVFTLEEDPREALSVALESAELGKTGRAAPYRGPEPAQRRRDVDLRRSVGRHACRDHRVGTAGASGEAAGFPRISSLRRCSRPALETRWRYGALRRLRRSGRRSPTASAARPTCRLVPS